MGADITFARLYKHDRPGETGGMYYIPASSLKGALRSAASRIASSYTSGRFTSCGQVDPVLIAKAHRTNRDTYEECSVCRLFGSPGRMNSPLLFFEDLIPQGGRDGAGASVITRVRIQDTSLRAITAGLYKSEVIWGMEFAGKIYYSDEVKSLLPLLLLAIAELRMDRLGRRSIIDVKLTETMDLRNDLESSWHSLLTGLETWLWDGEA